MRYCLMPLRHRIKIYVKIIAHRKLEINSFFRGTVENFALGQGSGYSPVLPSSCPSEEICATQTERISGI